MIALLIAVVTGCNPSTARPPFPPFRTAVIDTVPMTMSGAIEAMRLQLTADTVPVRRYHLIDGYLETERIRFDGIEGRAREVVIRMWANPLLGERVTLTAEIAYEWTADPSRIPRDRERAVPLDHPARTYIIGAIRAVRDSIVP